jgi:hypothetical protein
VLVGGGVLGLGSLLATATALVEDNRADELRAQIRRGDQLPSVAADYDAAVDRRDAARTTAWVFGLGAVAVGATAAALYFFDSPSPEAIRISPVATSTGGGLAASGRF